MRILTLACLLLMPFAGDARAGDACPAVRARTADAEPAVRIAALACNEHLHWFRPFIDRDGRLASLTVAEAEASLLDDGHSAAWQRVAAYWDESGLLARMQWLPGAADCRRALADAQPSPACRAFVVDTPWSAAFVSWVMARANLPGFPRSASHVDYVRHALQKPAESAYDFADPATAVPATGDLLCYVRQPERRFGHAGLREVLGADGRGLNMHCEIVIAANAGRDGLAWLIGGNVQQAVTMRLLNLNHAGRLWALPQRGEAEPPCAPDQAAGCNFNRQDWAVLLKLKPAEALARLPGAEVVPPAPATPTCCVHCVLGSGVPRCPPAGDTNR